ASVEGGGPGFGYGRGEAVVRGAPTYNGAALSSQVSPGSGTVFCRACGKPIEADARFCRFCGKSQAEPAGRRAASTPSRLGRTGFNLEDRLQQLFPRHPLQDEFMHIGSIAAFFMALIGFVLGLFTPAMGGPWLSVNFLLGSVALLLFLPAPSRSPFTFCPLPSHSIFLSPLSFPPVSFSSPSALSPSSPTLHLP